MSDTITALPTWEQMSDLDKGAALLHVWKRDKDGASYAVREYPVRYLSDPALVDLSASDRPAACRHAARVAGTWDGAHDRLGSDEVFRLYELALAEDERRG